MIDRLFILLAIIAATLAPSASHGVADDATAKPSVVFPLHKVDGRAMIAFDAPPGGAWGMRKFAREADRLLPGVKVFTRGSCSDHPRATCLRVLVGDWDDASQKYIAGESGWGAVTIFKSDRVREAWLNERTPKSSRYAFAVHEFGHALGLDHHRKHGIVGAHPDEVHLSKSELRALRLAYRGKK